MNGIHEVGGSTPLISTSFAFSSSFAGKKQADQFRSIKLGL
jgi:hypothetical protein